MRREYRKRFPRHQLQRKRLVSDPGMHHNTCVTHIPWCRPGTDPRWRGKLSRHSRRMRNPQFYLSGKRPVNRSLSSKRKYHIMLLPRNDNKKKHNFCVLNHTTRKRLNDICSFSERSAKSTNAFHLISKIPLTRNLDVEISKWMKLRWSLDSNSEDVCVKFNT